MKEMRYSGFICLLLLKNFPVFSQTSVLTQHNDIMRTGWDSTETILNTSNVNVSNFGFIFSRPLDDQMYAQPLVVSDVTISGVKRNIVFAATVNNTVYAYDADSASVLTPYWQINLTESGMRTPLDSDVGSACGTYLDFTGKIGIIGTPVIDTVSKRLFVVARSTDGSGNFYQYLHSIDITNGADTKVLIIANIAGTGVGNSAGNLPFDPMTQNQRCALLLLNGVVYIAYASHCDTNPYHGWVLGYDENSLTQKYVYVDNPDDGEAGIWMSGAGPAADNLGNVYVSSGNGSGTASSTNLQMSIIKLVPDNIANTLSESSYFTPFDYDSLSNIDDDFGPIQVLMIPNTNLALAGCKDGNVYLVDKDNMGGLGTTSNTNLQTLAIGGTMHASFGYYKGSTNEFIYLWSENTNLAAIPFDRISNLLGTPVLNTTLQNPIGEAGGFLSVSSNGVIDSTGILWVSHSVNCDPNHQTCPGILRAIKANDVTTELWNSNLIPADAIGNFAKFSCPTIANGKVYLSTFSNLLMVYGLKSNAVLPVSLISLNANRSNSSTVSLNWETASEQNNKGFEVQRSSINADNQFQSIAFVPSKALNGNSISPLSYQLSDTNSSANKTFYRLVQEDMDGNRTYSNIVAVNGAVVGGNISNSLLVIPNPTSGSMLTVQYKLAQQGNVILKLTDLSGKVLQNVSITGQNAGKHNYLFNNLGLLSGFYIATLELNGQTIANEKFVVSN